MSEHFNGKVMGVMHDCSEIILSLKLHFLFFKSSLFDNLGLIFVLVTIMPVQSSTFTYQLHCFNMGVRQLY